MDRPNISFELKPRQKQPGLTENELSRLWNAAICGDNSLAYEVVHELRDTHVSLRDGVFLF